MEFLPSLTLAVLKEKTGINLKSACKSNFLKNSNGNKQKYFHNLMMCEFAFANCAIYLSVKLEDKFSVSRCLPTVKVS